MSVTPTSWRAVAPRQLGDKISKWVSPTTPGRVWLLSPNTVSPDPDFQTLACRGEMGPVQEAPWRQHPVNLSLGNDSESPHGGRSSRGIYSPQFKEDTKGQSRPANAPASKASWGGFSDCSFKTKHPSGNTGYSGRIGNCSVACGVAVLVLEGGNPGSQQGTLGD